MFEYMRASMVQLKALITRSVTCSQTFQYSCTRAPIYGTVVFTFALSTSGDFVTGIYIIYKQEFRL